MKKSLLLLILLSLFSYEVIGQETEPADTIPVIAESETMMISQLKSQLKTQLKTQLESQLLTDLQSKSDKELNLVIDSMLLQLDKDIARITEYPDDSLAIFNSFLKNIKFSMNEQEPDGAAMFDRDELMKFHDKFYAEMLLMKDNLTRVRATEDKEIKARQLSGAILSFFNDSGFWEIMEMMMDKMMSFKTSISVEESE